MKKKKISFELFCCIIDFIKLPEKIISGAVQLSQNCEKALQSTLNLNPASAPPIYEKHNFGANSTLL